MKNIKEFVKKELAHDNTGHGYQHALRVYANAKKILQIEGGNEKIVLTAALVHDCIDKKLFDNQQERINVVNSFLSSQGYSEQEVEEIDYIITNISWNDGQNTELKSLNAKIVRDADRLDAIGAVGIIRTIEYGNAKGRLFYDDDNLKFYNGKLEFHKITESTLSHFYEKLLLLKDLMHTNTAKQMAKQRNEFMKNFLQEFYEEIE